jgi:acyl transferase domain-containing protein/surfactin synthase thioesterase subunit
VTVPPVLDGIAIVGMALRFPGARSPVEFWRNLRGGIETVRFFSDQELLDAGVDPVLFRSPHYVKASPVIDDFDRFDAAFFNYSPREASLMDPQNRMFLEVCWQALEDAGYDPERTGGSVIGVYAGGGSALTSYMLAYSGHPEMRGQTAGLQHINADRDFLSTRVSYKLNLTGPSLTVQTACSTSLVAVHLACQALQNGECDLALAGASTIRVPHISGYLAEPGNVHSTDGHCRAFDASACGTIFGSGVGAVLLKPLDRAVEDRNHVYAVITGSAINNDGAEKISYTAASVRGQAGAMLEALHVAGVSADTIDYVECHATGTAAGDPVEIQALSRAFRAHTVRRQFCAVGSVKSNIGHPEQSAGLAGLIKTALALHHRELPPTVHFATPNPNIPFEGSPFHVQARLEPWRRADHPRRAAVNSLGIGGTNAFIVLEEAPDAADAVEDELAHGASPDAQLCCLSAKTGPALRRRVEQFAEILTSDKRPPLADLCYTVNVSRSRLSHRVAAVASNAADLAAQLRAFLATPSREVSAVAGPEPVAFLFSGQGTQFPGMSVGLYETVPVFKEAFDQCDALFRTHLNRSLRDIVGTADAGRDSLTDTGVVQPALFAVEYALAQLWRSFGITPAAVMGHSIGELSAACIAGVLDLSQAVDLVAARAALMQALPRTGAMLACAADEERIGRALRGLEDRVGIAALNSPVNTVVSGESSTVENVRVRLEAEGVRTRPLAVSHAFHSALVDPMLPALEAAAARLTSRAPAGTFVSNLTGQPLTDAPCASYWRDHARRPVRFADGIRTLYDLGCRVFIEIGPGGSATAAGRECLPGRGRWLMSLGKPRNERATLLASLRALHAGGANINWEGVYAGARRARVSLPVYPFERTRHWLETVSSATGERRMISAAKTSVPHEGEAQAPFYRLAWTRQDERIARPARSGDRTAKSAWLIIPDRGGVGRALADSLRRRRLDTTVITRTADTHTDLFEAIHRYRSSHERHIVDLRGLDFPRAVSLSARGGAGKAEDALGRQMLPLARALVNATDAASSRLWIATRGAMHVGDVAAPSEPAQAMLWGFGRTLALEAPALWGGLIDLDATSQSPRADAEALVDAVNGTDGETQIAIRKASRYVARLDPLEHDERSAMRIPVRKDATYLITGGLGMLGLTIARWLVEARGARHLLLASRRADAVRSADQLAALRAAGASVTVVAADVCQSASVSRLFSQARRRSPPIRGVVHCAGVLRDGIVSQMGLEALLHVTAPKVRGAWLLHEHTRSMPLDFFLLQSSLLALTGSAGQANYTAANAFLDALVDYRRSRGLPAMAVNWGPWAGSGMASSAGARGVRRWRERGITPIDTALGIRALDALFDRPVDHQTVVVCDWPRYVGRLPRSSRFFDAVTRAPTDGEGGKSTIGHRAVQTRLSAVTPSERRGVVLDALQRQIARELGFVDGVDTRQPLEQLGVDSLMSVNLANLIEEQFGMRLPVATLIKSPSLELLADDLLAALEPKLASSAGEEQITAAEEMSAPVTLSHDHAEPVYVSATRGRGWLVFPQPNPAADKRLFCFNYAGGGAGIYRPWAKLLSNAIELVAIEPPGRGSRLDEPSHVSLDAFLDALVPELLPYLDKPAGFFGHCLGGLTMFEAVRRILDREITPAHLFVSGCRAPHLLDAIGPFEEGLLSMLLRDKAFDPLAPFHLQPDSVFAKVIQHFDIGVTDEFLAQPELRPLLMPAIRADFELAHRYRCASSAAWDVPITCFCGLNDPYVSRDDALGWSRYTASEFTIRYRHGTHFLVVEDRLFIVDTINRRLASAQAGGTRLHHAASAAR